QRGESSLLAAQTAALATRKGKDYGVPIERLREEWRARAAEHGLDRERCAELLSAAPKQLTLLRDAPDLDELLTGASTFTRRAAAELREQAAIETTTIARLKPALEHGHALPLRSVLVVDEAGMVGTRDLAELARHADERHAKLVLVGDERQLPEIEAGGAFRVLASRCGALELREVRRQREAWDGNALGALREGRVEEWARSYADADRLVTRSTAAAVREQLADDWWQSRERGGDSLMVALRRND